MILVFLYLLPLIMGQIHRFDWDVSYVSANPDGLHERRMIGINNHWPNPTIRVKKNDRVIINLTNSLPDRNTSLHFHGLFQKGYNGQDGPEFVTQCPIAPGFTFVYDFNVTDQTGTYWYHSHSGSQYGDGLRGLFIIEDDEFPYEYDEDVTLSVGDHYHLESPEIMTKFMTRFNPTGAEPIPQNGLFNETKNVTWNVKPDTTYLLRVVNMGLFVSHYVFVEDHTFTIVEVDGVVVEPYEVDSLYLTAAQRYVVLLKTKSENPKKNFRFVNILDETMLDILPPDLQIVSTNWVVYDASAELPKHLPYHDFEGTLKSLKGFDDFDLKPLAKTKLLPEPDYTIQVNLTMEVLGDGITYAAFNGITFTPPKVPTLYTVLSSDKNVTTDQSIYGSNTNSFVLQDDEVVEIILNNHDPGKHPFHLHGHNFQLISRFNGDEDHEVFFDPNNETFTDYPEYPMVRDTVEVKANGFMVLRFKANNPGVWFLHCHVDWHLEQGLALLLIENPLEIKNSQSKISSNHIDACEAVGMKYKGNAAGNLDFLDLHGENLQPQPLPPGFTFKGYAAMLACTIVAIYGLWSIYNYGMEDINKDNSEVVIERLYKILDDNAT